MEKNDKNTFGNKDHKEYAFEQYDKFRDLLLLAIDLKLNFHTGTGFSDGLQWSLKLVCSCLCCTVSLSVCSTVYSTCKGSLSLSLPCTASLAFSFPWIYINTRLHEHVAVDRMSQGGTS